MNRRFNFFVILLIASLTITIFTGCGVNKNAVAKLKAANFDNPTSILITSSDSIWMSSRERQVIYSADAFYSREIFGTDEKNIETWLGKAADGKYYKFTLNNLKTGEGKKTVTEITPGDYIKAVEEIKNDYSKRTDFDFSSAETNEVSSVKEKGGILTITFTIDAVKNIVVVKDDKIFSYEYTVLRNDYDYKCKFGYDVQTVEMPDIQDGWQLLPPVVT